MMRKYNSLILALLLILLTSCSNGESESSLVGNPQSNEEDNLGGNVGNDDWLIPRSAVKDGGPGKDGIPSIDYPIFVSADSHEADFIREDDLVVGVVIGDEVRAYPHRVLDWHEIVNDSFDDLKLSISYCPLTGTAFAWEGLSGSESTTFGVSGLLYNANLILYDRSTDSHWSQLALKCVNGKSIGEIPKTTKLVETSWFQWKSLYPDTTVLIGDIRFDRSYEVYPYGPYKTDHSYFVFQATPKNNALPNKERVFAIIDNENSRVFQFDQFSGGKIIRTQFRGINYLIVGYENIICAFELDDSHSELTFSNYTSLGSNGFFTDNEGNQWSVFGEVISGPRQGTVLKAASSVVSYWFAGAAFYPNTVIN
jgi:hypothetical protein